MNKLILILVIIFMTMLGSLGGFFFKKSTGSESMFATLKNKYLYIGGILYVVAALINVWVLKFLDYSVVMPMTAITYIWTLIVARVALKEKLTGKKVIGILAIITGALFIGLF